MNLEVLKREFATTERLRYLVDNEWRTSKTAKQMPMMDPSTGKLIAEAPCRTQEEVDSDVAARARSASIGLAAATRRAPATRKAIRPSKVSRQSGPRRVRRDPFAPA